LLQKNTRSAQTLRLSLADHGSISYAQNHDLQKIEQRYSRKEKRGLKEAESTP
jgi:hypothetical protein